MYQPVIDFERVNDVCCIFDEIVRQINQIYYIVRMNVYKYDNYDKLRVQAFFE